MLAIVLSRRDFRENDQIISLYTKEHGKLELLARGVKKIISKQSAHLEPFSVVFITVEQGKEIDHLIKTQPVEYFSGIRNDLNKSMAAGYLVSVTNTLIQTKEIDKRIFETLFGWLKFVEKSEQFRPLLVDGYIITVLSHLGFTPILDECVICEKTFHTMASEELSGKEKRPPGFYFASGGLICPACRVQKEVVGEQIFDCGLKEVSGLQVLLKGDWRLIDGFKFQETEQKIIHRLVYEFAVYHSEKQLHDWGRVIIGMNGTVRESIC